MEGPLDLDREREYDGPNDEHSLILIEMRDPNSPNPNLEVAHLASSCSLPVACRPC